MLILAFVSFSLQMLRPTALALSAAFTSSVPLPLSSPLPKLLSSLLLRHPHSSPTLFLNGNLGAGKTTVASGIIKELTGTANATSPTFLLCNSYAAAGVTVNHIDCYRLGPNCKDKVFGLLGDDALGGKAQTDDGEKKITIVEWSSLLASDFNTDSRIPRLMENNGGNGGNDGKGFRMDVDILVDETNLTSAATLMADGRLNLDLSSMEFEDSERTITFRAACDSALRDFFEPRDDFAGEDKKLLDALVESIKPEL
jgi:tRNA threonylcarbamoyl adenosine modification protein YjeE